jgi:ribonuclease BN (tRNA processing enzyme)
MNMIHCALLSTGLSALPAGIASPTARADEMSVTLLGTGTPTPRICCFSASTLVEAGQRKLLFDIGRGSKTRLFRKRVPLGYIAAHFITDMLSYHVVGFADMWLSGTLILRTRKAYDGPLVIGEDLMSVAISDTVEGQARPARRSRR